MAKRKWNKTNWLAVFVSIAVLISMFAVVYMRRNTKIVIADEENTTLNLIPRVTVTEKTYEEELRGIGFQERGFETDAGEFRYFNVSGTPRVIERGIDTYDYIFTHKAIALSDKNYSAMYLLQRIDSRSNESTHEYRILDVENGTFLRVLTINRELFENLTSVTPENTIIQNENETYQVNVRNENGAIIMKMSKISEV